MFSMSDVTAIKMFESKDRYQKLKKSVDEPCVGIQLGQVSYSWQRRQTQCN